MKHAARQTQRLHMVQGICHGLTFCPQCQLFLAVIGSPLVDMLNVIQTTIGIILTGIFGFILGNKIRNQ